MVTLTDIAAQKVGEFLSGQEQAEAGLRVAVRGGGCSGFQYQLALDEQREGDRIFARFESALARVEVKQGGDKQWHELLEGISGRVVDIGPGAGIGFQFYP